MTNVIYLIHCRRCRLQYVGETGQALHFRMHSHRFNIAHSRTDESPAVAHSASEVHTVADLSVMTMHRHMLERRCHLEEDQREQMDKNAEDLLGVGNEFKNRRSVICLLDSLFPAEENSRPKLHMEQ